MKTETQQLAQSVQQPLGWIFPGLLITVAAGVRLTVHYDRIDGIYHTNVKLFIGDTRIKQLQFDENNQLDLRDICCLVITRLATTYEPADRPIRTLLCAEYKPYSWEEPAQTLH